MEYEEIKSLNNRHKTYKNYKNMENSETCNKLVFIPFLICILLIIIFISLKIVYKKNPNLEGSNFITWEEAYKKASKNHSCTLAPISVKPHQFYPE